MKIIVASQSRHCDELSLEDCCTVVCNSSVLVIVTMNFKVHRTCVLTLLALPLACGCQLIIP